MIIFPDIIKDIVEILFFTSLIILALEIVLLLILLFDTFILFLFGKIRCAICKYSNNTKKCRDCFFNAYKSENHEKH